ncbi:MAG: YceD family protein [Patescibacteria group bacterium]|jgi:uncharacterized protein|nr:YceD family protein [Patescibacteria group bacterium]
MENISIKKLLNSDLGTKLFFEVDEPIHNIDLPPEILGKKVVGKITATKLDETIILTGDLVAGTILICDRCLENFKGHIPFHLEREYNLNRMVKSEEGLFIDKYGEIDLTIPIREEIILALPIKNICKSDCSGICSGCGVNLNHEKCSCKKSKKERK